MCVCVYLANHWTDMVLLCNEDSFQDRFINILGEGNSKIPR